ncbi:MAG: hypothetical protein VXW32_14320 [Myxococcota bacterium]|nr:hypothetical protein [Myxococcota bacterium]
MHIRLFFLTLLFAPGCRSQTVDADPSGQSLTDVVVASDATLSEEEDTQPPPPALFEQSTPLPTPELPDGLSHLGADGCAACHWPVVEAWKTSAHFGEPSTAMQKALHAAGNAPECSRCHFPFQVQHRELIAPTSTAGALLESNRVPNENWSPSLQAEGVGCIACHVREGTVLGSRDYSSPHPVRASEELMSSQGCEACHQLSWEGAEVALYDTYGEWSRTTYAEAGLTCLDCHMAPVAGAATPGGRTTHADHAVDARRGEGLSIHLMAPAKGAIRGQSLEGSLRVQNTGAGHAIPTGSPFKALLLQVELLDARGNPAGDPSQTVFGREVQQESPYAILSDTRLQAGDDKTLPFAIKIPYRAKAGRGTLRVTAIQRHADGELSSPVVLQELSFPIQ